MKLVGSLAVHFQGLLKVMKLGLWVIWDEDHSLVWEFTLHPHLSWWCYDMESLSSFVISCEIHWSLLDSINKGPMIRRFEYSFEQALPNNQVYTDSRESVTMFLNLLWQSDAIWWHRSGSTLALVMVWSLGASNHYLNQYWLLISEFLWHSPECNFTSCARADILHNEF